MREKNSSQRRDFHIDIRSIPDIVYGIQRILDGVSTLYTHT